MITRNVGVTGVVINGVRINGVINGVRVKTKRFKPTLYMLTPDITAFFELAIWQALRRLFMENSSAEEKA
jgi:hypothetical protein